MTAILRASMAAQLVSDPWRTLAALRVVLAALWLASADVHAALSTFLAGAAPSAAAAADAPWGSAWLAGLAASPLVVALYVTVLLAASAALLGLRARPALAVLALAGSLLLGAGQVGAATHHTHHLVWLAALLALAPVDARWALRPAPPGDLRVAHGALAAVWVTLGLIYFFPGLHKLLAPGGAWFTGEALRGHLHWKWAQSPGFEPLLRLDAHPPLLRAASWATLAFELGFVFALWWRWPRRFAVTAALAFHAATATLMNIHFDTLWPCLVAFADFGPAPARASPPAASPRPRPHPLAVLLVLAVAAAGFARAERAWPFASYPSFAEPPPSIMPALLVQRVDLSGRAHDVPLPTHLIGASWRLMGLYGTPGAPADFAAFWRLLDPSPAPTAAIRFSRVARSVDPDAPAPPGPARLLYELRTP